MRRGDAGPVAPRRVTPGTLPLTTPMSGATTRPDDHSRDEGLLKNFRNQTKEMKKG